MSIFEGIFYGIIQGLAEFLPVSSSAHLSLLQNFFGTENLEETYFTFTVMLHLGTLAAVLAVYYRDVWEMVKGFFTLIGKLFTGGLRKGLSYGERLCLLVAVATVPLVIAVPFSDKVEALSSVSWAVGVLLIINAAMLFVSDKISKEKLTLSAAKPWQALVVGIVQLFGVFPGISRSGSTITGGLFVGFEKKDAVRLSFLMSVPAIAGANILELTDLAAHPLPEGTLIPMVSGIIAAVVSGFCAIKLLQYISRSGKLSVFSVYCLVLGIAAIVADIFVR